LLLSPSRETASEVKKDMEKLKGQLIEALSSKGESILNGNNLNVKQTPIPTLVVMIIVINF
jgi:hypothetical protein